MKRPRQLDAPEIPIAPMIDCVFLMLVYFMTTSSLEKSEADLPIPAGQAGVAMDPLPAVDEQNISISETGEVVWNRSRFSVMAQATAEAALRERLSAFRATCRLAGSDPSIRLNPAEEAPYQAVVIVLDLIAEAKIEQIQFP